MVHEQNFINNSRTKAEEWFMNISQTTKSSWTLHDLQKAHELF